MLRPAFVIRPYRKAARWYFDDPSVGLEAEPLTDGVPELLDAWGRDRLTVWFHNGPVAGANHVLSFLYSDRGSSVYEVDAGIRTCMLCPALMKYFTDPPRTLFVRIYA